MKYIILCWGLLFFTLQSVQAQHKDWQNIDTVYKKALLFADEDADSLKYYLHIMEHSHAAHPNFFIFKNRLLGIYHDMNYDSDSASYYFLKAIQQAVQRNNEDALSSLYIDMALIYNKTKSYNNAISYFNKAEIISEKIQNQNRLASCYNNLGIVYRKLKNYDTAIFYYNKCLAIRNQQADTKGLIAVNSNLGALYLESERPQLSKPYFEKALAYSIAAKKDRKKLITLYANIGAAYIRLNQFTRALQYMDTVTRIMHENPSAENRSIYYRMQAGYYEQLEDYKQSYINYREFIKLQDSMLNIETAATTANLLERYNAIKRENDNKLLSVAIEKQKLQKRNWLIAATALFIILVLVGLVLYTRNKKNKLLEYKNAEITQINHQLALLNAEKNSLISIVSHDLSSPFANIKLWNAVLEIHQEHFDEESQKAIARIKKSTIHGETMIRKILDVERLFSKEHPTLDLHKMDICHVLAETLSTFEQQALRKQIKFHYTLPQFPVQLITDKDYFVRIIENIVSNAIKYTEPHKAIDIVLAKHTDGILFQCTDQGIGIPPQDIPFLFTKYGLVKNRPTAGEQSTGLGLSIVKRLVDELGAQISITSELQVGTQVAIVFTQKQ